MFTFLAIQSTYEVIEIALYKDTHLIDSTSEHKFTASKNLIPRLNDLLTRNHVTLSDITFIAANQGPGAFTSLRTVIATINGISFARAIPLIGINALEALRTEYGTADNRNIICLLNAFGKDVYFLKALGDDIYEEGAQNINELLSDIKAHIESESVCFIGNGAALYRNEISTLFGAAAVPAHMPEHCSLTTIANMGLNYWQHAKGITHQMLPIYLKEQAFKKSIQS